MPGLEWAVSDLGGTLTSETLSRNLRVAAQPKMRFRQLCKPEMAFGAHNGDQLTFKKMGNIDTEGRKIGEKEKVPVSQMHFSSATVSIDEYSNSIDYTWTLSLLAKMSVEDSIIITLMNDMAKVLDKAAAAPFRAADIVYVPTGTPGAPSRTLTTNGTAGATATRGIRGWDVKNIVDLMRATYNMPAFDGNKYLCVATSTFLRNLKDDSEWVEASKYGQPDKLFSGEVGSYYGTRFIEENNALDPNLPGGSGEAIFIAWDAVMEVTAYAEEIQAKVSLEYGRDRGLRWVWLGGFSKIWNHTTDGESRLVRVYSA